MSICHGHPGLAAGEGVSPVGDCVYREVVPKSGMLGGSFGVRYSDS